ncbi:MAG: hypothetical protein C7B46_11745 [Sulfobacillus benefaciens]|uniref:DUF1540 domain-containing protein n=1 Tax=Sulfobacillus benefaciens TaxID=453960 RepID=A0A2T2XEM6_9FIRM|nr:MAG: hypothetical protein C7B46_11745 [Sulfobacillus benefaciens]
MGCLMANQVIRCSVSYCRYNERGERCSLDHISVQPQMALDSGQAAALGEAHETSCGSYDPK